MKKREITNNDLKQMFNNIIKNQFLILVYHSFSIFQPQFGNLIATS